MVSYIIVIIIIIIIITIIIIIIIIIILYLHCIHGNTIVFGNTYDYSDSDIKNIFRQI